MYSNEDRMKVIRLYIEYDYNARAVIRELGYPSRNRLAIWYKEYQKQRNTRGRFYCALFWLKNTEESVWKSFGW